MGSPANEDLSVIPSGVLVICETCGEQKYLPRSRAQARRYCSWVCYQDRTSVSLATTIINALGGCAALSKELHVAESSINRWRMAGIPRIYHRTIVLMARGLKLTDQITADRLLETLAYGALWREGRVGRKASSMPPSPSTLLRQRRKLSKETAYA